MAIWLDHPVEEPFNGMLVVMNPTGLGDMSNEEREIVSEAVKKAIAGGWAVIRIYDKGVDPTPEWMDEVEDQCFGRTPSWLGLQKSQPLTKKSAETLLNQFPKSARDVTYVGLYDKVGKAVFVPPTTIKA